MHILAVPGHTQGTHKDHRGLPQLPEWAHPCTCTYLVGQSPLVIQTNPYIIYIYLYITCICNIYIYIQLSKHPWVITPTTKEWIGNEAPRVISKVMEAYLGSVLTLRPADKQACSVIEPHVDKHSNVHVYRDSKSIFFAYPVL